MGGGSGGHITPAVAVVREILKQKPRTQVEFWTDFKYYKNVTKLTTEIGVPWGEESKTTAKKSGPYIRVRRIMAGKFHRYSGWTFADYFKHFDITVKDLIVGNILGFFGFIGGILMSFKRMLLKRSRPDAIFLKGGYVGLAVGLVAKLLKIPFIIHESDTVAGLANRVLMKKAKIVAFGMPISKEVQEKHPNYVWTGIPVSKEFKPVSDTRKESLKKAFSFRSDKPLVVFTGGSQGAENINLAVREILPELLKFTSVGLVAGRKHYEDMIDLKRYENWEEAELESNFRMWEFNTTMDELLGAADVIVSRAGATTIAEMAALKKPTILVPFERLPGAHQLRNAERLYEAGAVAMVKDSDMFNDPKLLLEEVRTLVRSPRKCADMAELLHKEAKSNAAEHLAELIINLGTKN